jgi:O-acetylhomoserine (thiol)-lyase
MPSCAAPRAIRQSVIKHRQALVNLDAKTVEVDGNRVHLTGKEYQMLELLSLRKGTTLTKEMFLNHLYGGMDEPELKIIDVFICKLRKKLALACGGENYIETVWGRGYVLRDPDIVDIARIAEIAHRHGVPVMVDNTVATPFLCRPIDHGADIVIHSLTKYIGGHGTTIGGMIIDSGKFDWTADKQRFAILNEPDPSYHGVTFTEALGPAAYIGRVRVGPLRNTGAALAPHSAFLLLQGLETLGLRMERHCENAQKVAEYLRAHPKVRWVNYAGLPDSRYHALAQKMTGGRASGILSFGIEGGKEAGGVFIDRLKMILRLVNIGDAKSLACHPATTTHRQLSDDELAKAGVSQDLVRISVGIEHADDIIADIEQALAGV